jgi:fermentation-respiration switch protein FrsA (DUF1100 family)
MRFVLALFAFVVLGYVAMVGLLFLLQGKITFPASTLRVSVPEAGLSGFQDVEIGTEDGERLVAWWRPPEAGRALILYFHGNGGSLLNRRDRVRALAEDGRGVLIVSYRGYSGSTGTPSEAGLALDAEAAWRWLGSYAPGRIVLYGESLGSAVAVRLASEHEVGGVILDAPFTSIADVARPRFWFVPLDLLLTHRFRSIDRIGRIRAPLLVMHGDRDGVVPFALGERLFAAAPEPKRFERLAGIDHVSVLESGGLAFVRTFLGEVEARWRASLPEEARAPAR